MFYWLIPVSHFDVMDVSLKKIFYSHFQLLECCWLASCAGWLAVLVVYLFISAFQLIRKVVEEYRVRERKWENIFRAYISGITLIYGHFLVPLERPIYVLLETHYLLSVTLK